MNAGGTRTQSHGAAQRGPGFRRKTALPVPSDVAFVKTFVNAGIFFSERGVTTQVLVPKQKTSPAGRCKTPNNRTPNGHGKIKNGRLICVPNRNTPQPGRCPPSNRTGGPVLWEGVTFGEECGVPIRGPTVRTSLMVRRMVRTSRGLRLYPSRVRLNSHSAYSRSLNSSLGAGLLVLRGGSWRDGRIVMYCVKEGGLGPLGKPEIDG